MEALSRPIHRELTVQVTRSILLGGQMTLFLSFLLRSDILCSRETTMRTPLFCLCLLAGVSPALAQKVGDSVRSFQVECVMNLRRI